MPRFKFENCTSKQYVREKGWIPEARARMERIASSMKRRDAPRRLRYLTFCAEGALDVLALRNARIIRQSTDRLFDTVWFFDFAPQYVDKTLAIIEGATGFPIDFFKLMNFEYDDEDPNAVPKDADEGDKEFEKQKNIALYTAFREAFPFDLINLDVERYVIRPSEELPGHLLNAWDKILEWQKRAGQHAKKEYTIDQFTLFFTTKIGPKELPEGHRIGLINALNENVIQFPVLKDLLQSRFATDNAESLYHQNFDDFLKLAIPKALLSRALDKDWMLDRSLSYLAYEFRRQPPTIAPYTMCHYVVHFQRCSPSMMGQINRQFIPQALRVPYGAAIEVVFATACDDVDQLKVPIEAKLRESLQKLGVTEFAP